MDMDTLKAECLACTRCELCATRTNVVFGQGVPDAEVLFVGEGPGQSEDEQGLPFVGRSGQLLDKYLFAIDLDRKKNCYIANIVKCRPPQNRDPLPAESEACMPWLREQFRLLHPKIVVCLGRVAAQRMIRQDFSVTREHGQIIEKGGILFMGTFHPAALLRQPQNHPYQQHQQVILLVAALDHVMQTVPLARMDDFRTGLLTYIETQDQALCRRIDESGQLSDEDRETILKLSREFLTRFQTEAAEKSGE